MKSSRSEELDDVSAFILDNEVLVPQETIDELPGTSVPGMIARIPPGPDGAIDLPPLPGLKNC
ncbi:MAG: hypothetical protein SGI77_05125 [Pirellulaceae bacterium]|nr:hypothetical protein [Pirellulaceae bacterium]